MSSATSNAQSLASRARGNTAVTIAPITGRSRRMGRTYSDIRSFTSASPARAGGPCHGESTLHATRDTGLGPVRATLVLQELLTSLLQEYKQQNRQNSQQHRRRIALQIATL